MKTSKKFNSKGTTFIELLLYVSVFLIIAPLLLTVSVNSIRMDKEHSTEKNINTDSQFMIERIYDLITSAKRVDVPNSRLNDQYGKITLFMQDNSIIVIEMHKEEKKVKITEDEITSNLSSDNARVEKLYFDKITDNINDPDIVLGVNVRIQVSGLASYSALQNYVISANLERGDFDDDGTPDYLDKFPRDPECSGDADNDGICDELDNCVIVFNPFQEDFDGNGIGSACDTEDYDYEVAFNCTSDAYLIALINQQPPLPTGILKNILMSACPLSYDVLTNVIYREEPMSEGNLLNIFMTNVKLPPGILNQILNMKHLPPGHKQQIEKADEKAENYAWDGATIHDLINYQITVSEDGGNITFHDADYPNGENYILATDVIRINLDYEDPVERVTVTTVTASGSDINILDSSNEGSIFVDDFGFEISYDQMNIDTYIFRVSNRTSTTPLLSVNFNFRDNEEDTSVIVSPVGTSVEINRYAYYCPGGCSQNCRDAGTGIAVGDNIVDICYKENGQFPEWCLLWNTFMENNSSNPAYVGGTQTDRETVFWEKKTKAILSDAQMERLKSITVAGEVAYQSIAQLFCDQYSASCPMNGELYGAQNVQLYNWATDSWVTIGTMNLNGATSDQQIFQVMYNDTNPQKFLGGDGNRFIRSRMEFDWNGIPQPGEESAPSFMLIDYFTVHLKW